METTKTVARVNNVSILMIQGGENPVPIKPICEALGIAEDAQRIKLQSDEILSSVTTLSMVTGSDGKQYKMTCLPFMYIFGWLFTINPKNVKTEAQETVAKYRLECYKALFKHFTDQSEFLQQKQIAVEKQLEEVDRIRANFKETKIKLDEAKQLFMKVRSMTFDEWQANNNQLTLDFPGSSVEENES
jgi:P22_AR N-terminal domain